MNLDFSAKEDVFRAEVREWLHDNVPKERRPVQGPDTLVYDKAWQKRQYDAGWSVCSWPKEYGGRGLSLIQQLIWFE